MSIDIANEDLQVAFTNSVAPPDKVYSGDQGIDAVKIVPTKSSTCKAMGKYICTSGITLTFNVVGIPCPFSSTLYDFVSGAGSISTTSINCKADGQAILLKDDSGTCAGSWKLKASPFTVMACACTVKIADAGQTAVKGS